MNTANHLLFHVKMLSRLISYLKNHSLNESVANVIHNHVSTIKQLTHHDYLHVGIRDSVIDSIHDHHWSVALLLLHQYKLALSKSFNLIKS